MHPVHSNAEHQITAELHRRGYTQFEIDYVLLFKGSDVHVLRKEQVTKKMVANCDGYTLPDWIVKKKKLAWYLDGPHHLKLHHEIRDGDIDWNLTKREWASRRIGYPGTKMSGVRLHETVDWMVKQTYAVCAPAQERWRNRAEIK